VVTKIYKDGVVIVIGWLRYVTSSQQCESTEGWFVRCLGLKSQWTYVQGIRLFVQINGTPYEAWSHALHFIRATCIAVCPSVCQMRDLWQT